MKKVLLTTIIVVILIVICISTIILEPYSKYKYCILLTTCYNRQKFTNIEKLEIQTLYNKVIHDWIHKTNLPIVVVDSSGHTYPEFSNTRLKVCSFVFSQNVSSTVAEANSIMYALDNCKELCKYDYIIKITGKYYIPYMERILSNTLQNHDFYFQNRTLNNGAVQHSEVFGFKYKLGRDVINPLVTGECKKIMEERLGELCKSNNHTYSRFPSMINFYSAKRNDNLILELL
jgi:hypothetical protein